METQNGLLQFHDAANIFPMDDEHIEELAKDLAGNGLHNPIETLDGLILDGRRRYMACRIAGVEPQFKAVSVEDPIAYVLSLNLHRRHLTPTQLSMVGARASTLREKLTSEAKERQREGGKSKGKENLPYPAGQTRDIIGKAVGVSGKSIDYAAKVLRSGTPKLIAAVDADKIAVSTAAKMSLLPADRQDDFAENARGRVGLRKDRIVISDKPEVAKIAASLSKGEQEAKQVRDEFAKRLKKVCSGTVYTTETLAAAIGISPTTIQWFVRMCEVSPLVKVHRNFGRKGVVQFSFEKTDAVDGRARILQLARQIMEDPSTGARGQTAVAQIVSLLGG